MGRGHSPPQTMGTGTLPPTPSPHPLHFVRLRRPKPNSGFALLSDALNRLDAVSGQRELHLVAYRKSHKLVKLCFSLVSNTAPDDVTKRNIVIRPI